MYNFLAELSHSTGIRKLAPLPYVNALLVSSAGKYWCLGACFRGHSKIFPFDKSDLKCHTNTIWWTKNSNMSCLNNFILVCSPWYGILSRHKTIASLLLDVTSIYLRLSIISSRLDATARGNMIVREIDRKSEWTRDWIVLDFEMKTKWNKLLFWYVG